MGHISLSCCRIKKLSFLSFVYSLFLFLLAFPYHLCPSRMKSGEFVSPETNYEVSWYNVQVVAMQLPQFAMNRPPGNLHAFGCSFSHQKQTYFFPEIYSQFFFWPEIHAVFYYSGISVRFFYQWKVPLWTSNAIYEGANSQVSIISLVLSVIFTLMPWKSYNYSSQEDRHWWQEHNIRLTGLPWS